GDFLGPGRRCIERRAHNDLHRQRRQHDNRQHPHGNLGGRRQPLHQFPHLAPGAAASIASIRSPWPALRALSYRGATALRKLATSAIGFTCIEVFCRLASALGVCPAMAWRCSLTASLAAARTHSCCWGVILSSSRLFISSS